MDILQSQASTMAIAITLFSKELCCQDKYSGNAVWAYQPDYVDESIITWHHAICIASALNNTQQVTVIVG